MFQKEVAERIVAAPGLQGLRPARRSSPSGAADAAHRLRDPGPRLHPAAQGRRAPSSRSSALEAPRFPADAATLSRVVALAFGQRRKMLRASLKPLGPDVEALLAEAGIAPTDRAEQVPLEAFCRLSRLVAAPG